MPSHQILRARWPEFTNDEIAERLSAFLLERRRRTRLAAADQNVAAQSDTPAGTETRPDLDDEDLLTLSFQDRKTIARRAARLYALQLVASGVQHLDRDEQTRLKSLARGVGLACIPDEHRADELAAALHADMPWMAPATMERHAPLGPQR